MRYTDYPYPLRPSGSDGTGRSPLILPMSISMPLIQKLLPTVFMIALSVKLHAATDSNVVAAVAAYYSTSTDWKGIPVCRFWQLGHVTVLICWVVGVCVALWQ
eukprot:TRINITY_DN95256_c0_g1_i1.p1 TRINITY_DN95256_c0_g1~~TRINITY_DN95256_c0_g1_i1.p1  ORF type:complete len:103 (-),score=3.66 TRINITY_DN95256_c0_g1_i1:196-504(-)